LTRVSRRHVLVLGGGAAMASVLKPAMAEEAGFAHGMSAFPEIWWFDAAKADKTGRRS